MDLARSANSLQGGLLKEPRTFSNRLQISRGFSENRVQRRQCVQVRASNDRGGGFTAGFITGGVIFGTLGFLFAPQISRALLTEDQKLRLPRFLEEDNRDPEQTKQELSDKIAQLNAAIDDVSNQMKSRDPKPEVVPDEVTV